MSNTLKTVLTAAIVALVVTLGVGFLLVGGHKTTTAGNTTQSNLSTWAPANASAFVGPYGVESDAGYFDAAGALSNFLGGLAFSSNTTTVGPTMRGVAGTCNTASSTLFAVRAPSGATSTVDVEIFTVGGNATTSTLTVGTSTLPAVTAASSISATLINGAVIATNTVPTLSGGVTVGPANSFVSAGSGTFTSIEVAPTDYIIGFATSTATGAGANSYAPGFSTCSYKIIETN
jgi:hypothetical protein